MVDDAGAAEEVEDDGNDMVKWFRIWLVLVVMVVDDVEEEQLLIAEW